MELRFPNKSENIVKQCICSLLRSKNPGGGGGGHSTNCCTHARPQVLRTHPKHVLSIGQIYTLFKYFRVFFSILPPKQV